MRGFDSAIGGGFEQLPDRALDVRIVSYGAPSSELPSSHGLAMRRDLRHDSSEARNRIELSN